MKTIKATLAGFLAVLAMCWWVSDGTSWSSLNTVLDWRAVLAQLTGVLAIGVMSLAMVLAARPAVIERWLGGLDKVYRLHKWLGISALVFAVLHWIISNGPKWATKLGLMERRLRGPRPVFEEGSLQQLFMSLRGVAEAVGEWAFYAAVVLMVLALIKRFPYRRFFQTHRVLALCYLVLVFHAVVLLKFDYWRTPIGGVVAVMLGAGTVAAVLSLFRKRLSGVIAHGRVAVVDTDATLGTATVEVDVPSGWAGHQAGQFAYVTFHADEGPHPYTIASAWGSEKRLRFVIKALGDYTRELPSRLSLGGDVRVEGPYGAFTFEGSGRGQVWVSGGIGVTPFLARMQSLARSAGATPAAVDLFHCVMATTAAQEAQMADSARAAQVRLHTLVEARDGRLDAQRLAQAVPDWRERDIWFCGPSAFGRALRAGLVKLGLPAERFHQELFEMR